MFNGCHQTIKIEQRCQLQLSASMKNIQFILKTHNSKSPVLIQRKTFVYLFIFFYKKCLQSKTGTLSFLLVAFLMNFFYMILDITAYEGKLTLHVHVGRLVHKMHEQLSGVDEDLVSAVSDRAIPPRSLWQGRKNDF